MTIQNQQAIAANSLLICMPIKVLQLLYTKLIYCLAVLRDPNNLILQQILLFILGREVVLTLEDNKEWDSLACCVDALDNYSLLLITQLHYLQSSLILYYYNYYSYQYHAYYKASLVKVIGVFVLDTILSFSTLYKLKLASNNNRIFIEGSFIVILLIKLNFKLRAALNKVCRLVLTNQLLEATCKQRISYIFYISKLERVSFINYVYYMPNNRYLF